MFKIVIFSIGFASRIDDFIVKGEEGQSGRKLFTTFTLNLRKRKEIINHATRQPIIRFFLYKTIKPLLFLNSIQPNAINFVL